MRDYTPDEFAAALIATVVEVAKDAHRIVDETAEDVRNSARQNAKVANRSHAKNVHRHINYDVDQLEADIGYDDVDQGRLGIILEYGHGRARNAPQRNLGRALDEHEERFRERLADVTRRDLEG